MFNQKGNRPVPSRDSSRRFKRTTFFFMKRTIVFLLTALLFAATSCSLSLASDEQDITFYMDAESYEEGGGAKVTLMFNNEDVFQPLFWAQLFRIEDGESRQVNDVKFFQYGELLPLGGWLIVDKDIAEIDIPDLEEGDYRIMVALSKGSKQHSGTTEFSVYPKVEPEEDDNIEETEE